MTWYQYFAGTAFLICLISLSYHLFRLIRLGVTRDYSQQAGNLKQAITYSFTGAMSPSKKESAYLHLPTYIGGLLYHFGTFLAFALFLSFFFLNLHAADWVRWGSIGLLLLSAISGAGIFIKRLTIKKLSSLSNPDDYISNLLVTLFQIFSLGMLINESFAPPYFICTGILFLYIPLGKLKHAMYFFAARYHLGLFYGWRGVWSPKKS